ncbi:MAG: hypothetical protein DME25_08410, partial [Verrucomicrobia bacterium]
VTATDANSGLTSRSFGLTVNSVNDLPLISSIPNQTINENTSTAPIAFLVSDVETLPAALSVVPSSSNSILLPAGGMVLNGTGTNRTLVLTPASNQFGSAVVTLTVTDTNGGESKGKFRLTVTQTVGPPGILLQPQGQTVTNGATASFIVNASGTAPLTYQWSRDGAILAAGTNAILVLAGVQPSDAGSYTVVVRNAAGSVSSAPAILRVLVAPSITAIQQSGGTARISFLTEVGLNYTVEYTDKLEAPNWSALSPVVGNRGVITVTDPAAGGPKRFYRVRVD